ncbi:MAG: SGNH/GDSL hydrolase family protein [Treponema sp.]|nr:SGNH/GDSL hydrolase family protein [Treponema sp.]
MISSIIAWGDSILKGIVSQAGESKDIEVIEDSSLKLAADALGFEFTNKSIFGATVTKIQSTQKKNISKGLKADLCVIEAGDNDSDYDWAALCANPDAPLDKKTSPQDFKTILAQMVATARENKITPVLMTPPPLVGETWFKNICIGLDENIIRNFVGEDIFVLCRNQIEYAKLLKEVAKEQNVQLVDMQAEFFNHPDRESLMCPDGVHPNPQGYKFMSEIWIKIIPQLKLEF